MRVLLGVRKGNGPREADVVGRPAGQLLADALKRVHLARDLRERVLDDVPVTTSVEGFPSARTDTADAAAFNFDEHHAEVGMREDDIRLAVRRLVLWPLLELGDVAVDLPRRLKRSLKRRCQPILRGTHPSRVAPQSSTEGAVRPRLR